MHVIVHSLMCLHILWCMVRRWSPRWRSSMPATSHTETASWPDCCRTRSGAPHPPPSSPLWAPRRSGVYGSAPCAAQSYSPYIHFFLFQVNYGETLSTLLFASRCMSVKTAPVQHEEIDYAEMCALLRAQLSEVRRPNLSCMCVCMYVYGITTHSNHFLLQCFTRIVCTAIITDTILTNKHTCIRKV